MDDRLNRLLLAAKVHGDESGEPEHEVGDLQQILGRCWTVMNDSQRACVYGSFAEFLQSIE